MEEPLPIWYGRCCQFVRGTLSDEMACASNNWRLLQYRVDTGVRKALFYHHKATLPKFM